MLVFTIEMGARCSARTAARGRDSYQFAERVRSLPVARQPLFPELGGFRLLSGRVPVQDSAQLRGYLS